MRRSNACCATTPVARPVLSSPADSRMGRTCMRRVATLTSRYTDLELPGRSRLHKMRAIELSKRQLDAREESFCAVISSPKVGYSAFHLDVVSALRRTSRSPAKKPDATYCTEVERQ